MDIRYIVVVFFSVYVLENLDRSIDTGPKMIWGEQWYKNKVKHYKMRFQTANNIQNKTENIINKRRKIGNNVLLKLYNWRFRERLGKVFIIFSSRIIIILTSHETE